MSGKNGKKLVNKEAAKRRESLNKNYGLWVLLNQARIRCTKQEKKSWHNMEYPAVRLQYSLFPI